MSSQRAHAASSQATRDAQLLDASIVAARRAVEFITQQARGVAHLEWRSKQRADFVTDVDTGAESRIRDVLADRVPDALVIGEELSPDATTSADTVFIVDPLDGTTNFLHGYPWYAVSIGVVQDGELAAGVVLNVAHGELFTARRGAGAFRDGERVHVSIEAEPGRALIGTGFPFKHLDRLEEFQRQFARLTRDAAGIRRAGSAALDLADVACGRFDGFWELRLAPWDMAAGILLIREAGGRVTDLQGVDIAPRQGEVVASNGLLHPWMLEALR
jgi:myo-inositol-1(or 4)-monophosphatase